MQKHKACQNGQLEIAAAGGHSVIMSGPPGKDKRILASSFVGIFPEMNESDALDSATLQSLNYILENSSVRRFN